MTAGTAFDLFRLLHSLPELWIKKHLSVPWQLLLLPCACAYPEHFHHSIPSESELSGWWDACKTKLFSLMMRYRICHNSPCAGAFSKLIKNGRVKSISKAYFHTDLWDDLIHHTSLCKVAAQTLLPTTLRITDHRHSSEKGWQTPSQLRRGQDRGNAKVGKT